MPLYLVACAFVLFASLTASAGLPHVVFVSVDTLRADRLGAYGYDGNTSPFLDSLAKRGWRFEEALVTMPATTPSHASMLTSSMPWRHGSLGNAYAMNDRIDTLATALSRRGYRTAAAVAVNHIGRAKGFARGFHAFTEPSAKDGPRRAADKVSRDAYGAIDAHVAAHSRTPLFLFVHFFDVHYPYRWWDASESNPTPYAPAEINDVPKQSRRYDEGIRQIDGYVRRLHEKVRAKLGDNVIFVVTSDHGEQLGEHGFCGGHADIYRETVRVPLIVTGPGIKAATVTAPVSSMDIGVSLLSMVGGRFANGVDGQNFIEIARRAEGLFTRWLPSKSDRALLVTGNPWYSRSLLLVDGSNWFIRNFDHVYGHARVITPSPGAGTATWNVAPREPKTSDDTASYAIPFTRYEPYNVTIDHVAARPDCKAELNVLVAPGVAYLGEPAGFQKSIRITVPAARLDALSVTVKPASCAGTTAYSVARHLPLGEGRSITTFFHTLVARKKKTTDELYDVEDDPGMRKNLAPSTATRIYGQKLRALYEAAVAVQSEPNRNRALSPEDVRKLRSLGYIQ